MKDKKRGKNQYSQHETKLMEQFRQHPEIMARVQSILEIANNQEGPLKTADEVEELLIEEMRRLGGATLHHWANQAEEGVSTELKRQDPTVRSRKKKTLKWWCVFGLVEVRERIWRSPTRSYLQSFAPTTGRHATRTLETIGAGADGLWLRAFLWPGRGKCAGARWV
jgi:hypothetical protein